MRNTGGRLRHEIFQRHATARSATASRLTVETFATLRNFARGRGVFDDQQLVARHRHALESKNLNRDRRACALHRLAALVEQRTNASGVHAADEVVADLECAALDKHRRDGTLARIELRFDDRALRPLVGIRFEIENFSLQQHK